MTLDEEIDTKNYIITLKGKKEDIHRFAYALDKAMSYGTRKNDIDEIMKGLERDNRFQQLSFTPYHRVNIKKNKMLLYPNTSNSKVMFNYLLESYKKAKEFYVKDIEGL